MWETSAGGIFLFVVAFIGKEALIQSGHDIGISVGLLEILLTLCCGLEAQCTEVVIYVGPSD